MEGSESKTWGTFDAVLKSSVINILHAVIKQIVWVDAEFSVPAVLEYEAIVTLFADVWPDDHALVHETILHEV